MILRNLALAAALGAGLALLAAQPASATKVQFDPAANTVSICDPAAPTHCAKPDAAGNIPTTGAGGGGGAVTLVDGADVTQGAKADAPCATAATACTVEQRLAKLEQNSEDLNTPTAVKNTAITTGGATPYHLVTAASTNSTLISTGAHTLYTLTLTGLNTTAGYLRLYDTAAAPTCSSSTGAVHTYLVIGSATQQGGLVVPLPPQGEVYTNGLAYCFTGGPTDTDNTSGPAGALVNLNYK